MDPVPIARAKQKEKGKKKKTKHAVQMITRIEKNKTWERSRPFSLFRPFKYFLMSSSSRRQAAGRKQMWRAELVGTLQPNWQLIFCMAYKVRIVYVFKELGGKKGYPLGTICGLQNLKYGAHVGSVG